MDIFLEKLLIWQIRIRGEYKILNILEKEKDYNLKKMIKWFTNSRDEHFNIVCHPLYDLNLIICFLDEILYSNKKVLYLTENQSYVKKFLHNKKVSHRQSIVFSKIENVHKLNSNFDLVIFDDVNINSDFKDSNIIPFLKNIKCRKKIILTMKEILNSSNLVYEINGDFEIFKEPRTICTKIDLDFDIPYVVFEFLEWFMINEGKVILLTKDEESSLKVYAYMKKYVSFSPKLKNLFLERNFKSFEDFEEKTFLNSYIYVCTTNFLREMEKIIGENTNYKNELNIVVFSAENKNFNYKRLLGLCSVCNFLSDCKNEIIFVFNYENMEILMAKSISRSYNKRIWEFGLKKY